MRGRAEARLGVGEVVKEREPACIGPVSVRVLLAPHPLLYGPPVASPHIFFREQQIDILYLGLFRIKSLFWLLMIKAYFENVVGLMKHL